MTLRFAAFAAVKIQVQGLLGCDIMLCCGRMSRFQRSMLPPSSGWRWRQHGSLKR